MNNTNNTTFALILTVENKKSINNINNNSLEERDFEKESIRCIKNWRLNGGWLKNIPIYIHCPSLELSKETIQHYNDYNAVLLYNYIEDIYKYDYGFINVHYSGKYFSSILKEDILIHIDLDMELLRPLSVDFFDPILKNNFEVMVGGYSNSDYKNQRKPLFGNRIFNTNLIITKSKEYSFLDFYKEMIKEYSSYPDKTDYYIDETLVEKVLLNQEFNYLEQTYYEMGEGYVNNLDTLPDIYFWEEHIYRTPTNNVDLKLTFYKVKKYFKQLGQIWI